MRRNALIAVALVSVCSCCALGIVVAAFVARPAAAPSAPAAAVAPSPMPSSPPPAPPPPVLTPTQQLAVQARAELARLEALDDDAYSAELQAWGTVGEPSYEALQRNVDAHFGERAVYQGRIEEIHDQPTGGSQMRLSIGRGRVLWVQTIVPPHEDLVAGRRARVFGYVVGNVSYTSQAGWDITLPGMVAIAVHSR